MGISPRKWRGMLPHQATKYLRESWILIARLRSHCCMMCCAREIKWDHLQGLRGFFVILHSIEMVSLSEQRHRRWVQTRYTNCSFCWVGWGREGEYSRLGLRLPDSFAWSPVNMRRRGSSSDRKRIRGQNWPQIDEQDWLKQLCWEKDANKYIVPPKTGLAFYKLITSHLSLTNLNKIVQIKTCLIWNHNSAWCSSVVHHLPWLLWITWL